MCTIVKTAETASPTLLSQDKDLAVALRRLILHSTCRSSELDVNLDDVCVPKQIVLLVKDLVRDSQQDKLKFIAVTMLNVVLQRAAFDEKSTREEMIVDVCRDALSSMTEIVKHGGDLNAILSAVVMLCGTCAGGSR